MRSFEPLCGRKRSFFLYDNGVRSFANVLFIKDSVFAYKEYILSPYFIDHVFYGINIFQSS